MRFSFANRFQTIISQQHRHHTEHIVKIKTPRETLPEGMAIVHTVPIFQSIDCRKNKTLFPAQMYCKYKQTHKNRKQIAMCKWTFFRKNDPHRKRGGRNATSASESTIGNRPRLECRLRRSTAHSVATATTTTTTTEKVFQKNTNDFRYLYITTLITLIHTEAKIGGPWAAPATLSSSHRQHESPSGASWAVREQWQWGWRFSRFVRAHISLNRAQLQQQTRPALTALALFVFVSVWQRVTGVCAIRSECLRDCCSHRWPVERRQNNAYIKQMNKHSHTDI